jgi:hypothetical protein
MLWGCNVLASGKQLPQLENDPGTRKLSHSLNNVEFPEDASYLCDACGEEIVIPLDVTQGTSQTYVEDCPVCCRANTIHVQIEDSGRVHVWAEPEQDHDWST